MGPATPAFRAWALGCALALVPGTPFAQDKLRDLQAEYNREKDPVRRAKLIGKLGEEQMGSCQRQVAAGDYAKGLTLLGEYRDEVVATEKGLDASGADAEKKPAGFKELEMSVRHSLGHVKEILLEVPDDWSEPFVAIRAQLEGVNKELLKKLFPRRPGQPPKDGAPKP
jgi:hypothetical protein